MQGRGRRKRDMQITVRKRSKTRVPVMSNTVQHRLRGPRK